MSEQPHHLAIIMDGNRRWARERGLNVLRGHNRGADTLKDICSYAYESGVRWMTVFAFSAQNWSRPKSEVEGLMMLMRRFLQSDAEELLKENVKFRVIGRRDRLGDDLVKLIEGLETKTKGNTGLNLTIAIDYGGQQELVAAARLLAEEVATGIIAPAEINEDLVKSRMASSMLPQVDLLIRTGGEYRISNFMLWDLSYAELHFTPVYWPDFSVADLARALKEFGRRERRFGGDAPDDMTVDVGSIVEPPQNLQ
jgi:undecaprenyl diphosphate synthase